MSAVEARPTSAPLAGRTVAVTRPRERAHALITALEALGASVLVTPAITVAPPATCDALDDAVRRLAAPANSDAAYHWLALTSAVAVDAIAARLAALTLCFGVDHATRVAVVGEATARAAQARLGRVDLVPARHTADGLAAAMPAVAGARVLFPSADRARDALPALLTARGARVDRVVAYRTLDASPDALAAVVAGVAAGTLDLVIVASPSAAGALVQALAAAGVPATRCAVACIGPTTADACRTCGLHIAAVAPAPTDAALVRITLDYLARGAAPLPTC